MSKKSKLTYTMKADDIREAIAAWLLLHEGLEASDDAWDMRGWVENDFRIIVPVEPIKASIKGEPYR